MAHYEKFNLTEAISLMTESQEQLAVMEDPSAEISWQNFILYHKRRRRMTITAFANMVGVSRFTVHNWCKADCMPQDKTRTKVEAAVGQKWHELQYSDVFPPLVLLFRKYFVLTHLDVKQFAKVAGFDTVQIYQWLSGLTKPSLYSYCIMIETFDKLLPDIDRLDILQDFHRAALAS